MTVVLKLDEMIQAAAREAVEAYGPRLLDEIRTMLDDDPSQLVTTAQLADTCPAFSVGALLKLAERARRNGLADHGAVTRKGRKLIWHRRRFMEWAQDRNRSTIRSEIAT